MSVKFRSRVFLYLLLLLAALLASEAAINVGVEWLTCRIHPGESMRVGLLETAHVLGLSLLLVPLLVWLAWRISSRVAAPLRAMAAASERVCAGHWNERIETRSMPDDETKRLATSMNAAFDNYTAVLNRLKRFSGDAAHQLRTPIAAMRNLGEVALARPRSNAVYRRTLGSMLDELDRMTRLVEQLLQLAQLEAGALSRRFAPVSLRQAAEQVLRAYEPLAEAQGLRIRTAFPAADLEVQGLAELLVEMLGILLDNALRHTPEGGTVLIDMAELPGGDARVAVVDGGVGIPTEYAQTIFERFAQIPGSQAGATGLGLSLAAEIARLHGGKLELANPGQPGARFECRLPRAHAGQAKPTDGKS